MLPLAICAPAVATSTPISSAIVMESTRFIREAPEWVVGRTDVARHSTIQRCGRGTVKVEPRVFRTTYRERYGGLDASRLLTGTLRRIGCEPSADTIAIPGLERRRRRLQVLLPVGSGLCRSSEPDQQIADIEQCLEIARIQFDRPAPVLERLLVVPLLRLDDAEPVVRTRQGGIEGERLGERRGGSIALASHQINGGGIDEWQTVARIGGA